MGRAAGILALREDFRQRKAPNNQRPWPRLDQTLATLLTIPIAASPLSAAFLGLARL